MKLLQSVILYFPTFSSRHDEAPEHKGRCYWPRPPSHPQLILFNCIFATSELWDNKHQMWVSQKPLLFLTPPSGGWKGRTLRADTHRKQQRPVSTGRRHSAASQLTSVFLFLIVRLSWQITFTSGFFKNILVYIFISSIR